MKEVDMSKAKILRTVLFLAVATTGAITVAWVSPPTETGIAMRDSNGSSMNALAVHDGGPTSARYAETNGGGPESAARYAETNGPESAARFAETNGGGPESAARYAEVESTAASRHLA
jgi:hypothetical protein